MVRRSVCAVLAASLLLAGAGGCDRHRSGKRAVTVPERSAAPVQSASPNSGQPVSQAQVTKALLSITDMPTGFTVDPDRSYGNESISGCDEVESVIANKIDTRAEAEANFKVGDFGAFVSESIIVQPEKAQQDFDRFTQAISRCPSFISTRKDGSKYRIRLTTLSFPKLGDDTFSGRLASDVNGVPIQGDVVMVRLGDNLMVLRNVRVGSPDSRLTELLVRRAVNKVSTTL